MSSILRLYSVNRDHAGIIHGFMFGDAFHRGLSFAMGQVHAQKHMPVRLEHIAKGELHPEVVISHLPLSQAARSYGVLAQKQEKCRKVVLTPDGPAHRDA